MTTNKNELLQRIQDDVTSDCVGRRVENTIGTWLRIDGEIVVQDLAPMARLIRQIGNRLLAIFIQPAKFPLDHALTLLRSIPESVMNAESLAKPRLFLPTPFFGFDEITIQNPPARTYLRGAEWMTDITGYVYSSYRCEHPHAETEREAVGHLASMGAVMTLGRTPAPFVRARYVYGATRTSGGKRRALFKWSELFNAAKGIGHQQIEGQTRGGFIDLQNFEGTNAVLRYEHHYSVELHKKTYTPSPENAVAWFHDFCIFGEEAAQKHLG